MATRPDAPRSGEAETIPDSVSSRVGGGLPEMEGYAIEGELGVGGMGVVYRAFDGKLQRAVAIKVLNRSRLGGEQAEIRFQEEAQLLARLQHPNVVPIYTFGTTEAGISYFVMELVAGSDLKKQLSESGPPALKRAAEIFAQICDAVAAAHDWGIIHRDLKPANVLIDRDGWVKVADFGLAAMTEQLRADSAGIGGTPAYMPEEQRSGIADERSDVFSLGIILHELLAGHRPDAAPCRSEWQREIPAELAAVVQRATQREPDGRFQDVRAFKAAFLQALPESLAGRGPDGSRTATLLLAEFSQAAEWRRTLPVREAQQTVDRLLAEFDRCLAGTGGRRYGFDGSCIRAEFPAPSEAVRTALAFQWLARSLHLGGVRIGLHSGELRTQRLSGSQAELPFGPAVDVAEQIRVLAVPGQILLSGPVFSEARQHLRQHPLLDNHGSALGPPPHLIFRSHGRYRFTSPQAGDWQGGILEIDEVGAEGLAPLTAPEDTPEIVRVASQAEQEKLSWRPSVGQEVPFRPDWKLVRRVGEGGFGEVWLGRSSSREERVFKFCFDAERLRSFRREEKLFSLLQHGMGERQDIVPVLGVQMAQAPYFVEYPYFPCGSLIQWADATAGRRGFPDESVKLDHLRAEIRMGLFVEVARAVAAAHSLRIVHKDIKPGNVLIRLDPAGCPHGVLADFGLSVLGDPEALAALQRSQGGLSGDLLAIGDTSRSGTRLYAAPEYLTGAPPTFQGDVYSLGVLLYQLAIGNLSQPLAPGWENHITDPVLRADIAAAVAGDAAQRLDSAEEIARRVERLPERRRRHELDLAEQSRSALRRRLTKFALIGSAALAVAAAGLAWGIVRARRAQAVSEHARNSAEALINQMLVNLRQEIEPLGRLTLLDEVSGAARHYFEALPESEKTSGTRVQEAAALASTGEIALLRGDSARAVQTLTEASAMFERETVPAGDPARAAFLRTVAGIAIPHAKALARQGGGSEASGVLHAALRRFPADSVVAFDSRRAHSLLHESLGDVAYETKNYADAAKWYREFADLHGKLTAAYPDHLATAKEWGWALVKTARAAMRQKQFDDCQKLLGKARVVYEGLSAQRPGDLELEHDAAVLEGEFGEVHFLSADIPASRKHYRHFLEKMDALCKHDPTNAKWQWDLSNACLESARPELAAKNFAAARSLYERARVIREALCVCDPKNFDWLHALARVHHNLGRLAMDHDPKNPENIALARSHHAKAAGIYEKLSAALPSRREFARSRLRSMVYLGSVQFLARTELGALPALQALQQAVNFGEELAAGGILEPADAKELETARTLLKMLQGEAAGK